MYSSKNFIRHLLLVIGCNALFSIGLQAQDREAPEKSWDEKTRKIEKERRQGVNYDDLEFSPEMLFLWKQTPYTGPAYSLHKKTGRVKMMLNFKDGKWHGEVSQFHKNGKKYYLAHYKEGVQHGLNVYWDESGRKTKTRIWKNGEVVSEKDEEKTGKKKKKPGRDSKP